MHSMKLGIMQPYFCAYIGYYQLINYVDIFILYDNIEYVKKGWYNRNKILLNDKERLFTIPLKKDSDFLDVRDRFLAENSIKERKKILAQIKNSYIKAPYFKVIFPILEDIFLQKKNNLFEFIHYSLIKICELLEIKTKITVSSTLKINHQLKSQEKVIAICKFLSTENYINSSGGKKLYCKQKFEEEGITLDFIKPKEIKYKQFNEEFIPSLSIIDVLMFNDLNKVREFLKLVVID